MNKFILLVLVVCVSHQLFAQHEVGVSLGTSHLLGDFGGGPGVGTIFLKDLDIKSTRPSVGLFYRYNFAKFLGVRTQFLYGELNSNDLFSEEISRFNRGLASKSIVLDGSVQLEFNFIPLQFCSTKAKFSPYVAAGIGFSNVNATISSANLGGIPANEKRYMKSGNVLAVNIPMTIGVKFKAQKNIAFALEVSYRMAFTDKLDAYIRNQQNDHFFFISANVSYVFCKRNKKDTSQAKCFPFY